MNVEKKDSKKRFSYVKVFLMLFLAYAAFQTIRYVAQSNEEKPKPESAIRQVENVNKLAFCGNELLDRRDVYERIGYEVSQMANTGFLSPDLLQRIERYQTPICSVLKAYNVPEDVFYIAVIESRLTNAVSPAGARGFFQIMPITAFHYGQSVSNLDDPIKSARLAAFLLSECHKHYCSWPKALAAYNAGIYGASKGLEGKSTYWDAKFQSETDRYVAKIIAVKIAHEIFLKSAIEPQTQIHQ